MATREDVHTDEKKKKDTGDSVITIGGGGGLIPKDKKPKKAKVGFESDHFDYDGSDGELNSKMDVVATRIEIECGDLEATIPLIGDDFEIRIYYSYED